MLQSGWYTHLKIPMVPPGPSNVSADPMVNRLCILCSSIQGQDKGMGSQQLGRWEACGCCDLLGFGTLLPNSNDLKVIPNGLFTYKH